MFPLISHKLLDALGLGAGIVRAAAFQQVDHAPHTETGTESDHEGLQSGDKRVGKGSVGSPKLFRNASLDRSFADARIRKH